MSIVILTGTPGTGKSLHAAAMVRKCLNRGRPVIGNFQIDRDAPVKHPECYTFVENSELSPALLWEYADEYWTNSGRDFKEDYLTFVVDECQLLFNSRDWTNRERLAWVEFLSQHRKMGYRVVLVAQSAKMVDNQFRMLIEYEVQHRKMSNFGVFGWLVSSLFLGRLFYRVTYYYQMGERIGSEWYVMRKKDAMMYDTHQTYQRLEGSAFDRSVQLAGSRT